MSQLFVENSQFSNQECASTSPIFVEMFTNFRRKLSIFKKGVRLKFTNFRRKLSIFKQEVRLNFTNVRPKLSISKGGKGVGSGRVGSVGRSPIRFFDLILNNALELRASNDHCKSLSTSFEMTFCRKLSLLRRVCNETSGRCAAH